jgi:Tol biopolymer transport system component
MNSPKTDIFLLSTDDGTEKTLIDHPATDFNPLWMPDGKNIIFFSDRTGTVSAWSQKVSDGTADGEEKLIMDLNRLSPKTIIPNGDLYISFLEGGHDVYNAIIDPESGKVISAPKRVVETNVGWNGAACFSPDGKIMAYVSQRGVLDPTFSWGQQSLILRDIQTGEERELIPRSSQLVRGRTRLKWSPDSDEILFVGRDQTGPPGAYVLNIHNSSFESITGEKDFKGADVVWENDSNKFYYFYRGDVEKNGVYSIDRNSHEETKILSENNIMGLTHRSGNNELAFISGNVIKRLNLDNYEVAEFFKLDPGVKHSYIEWSPDGNWLYFMKCFGEGTVELWRVNANGNNVQLIGKSFPHLTNLSIHPDGKRLAFTVSRSDENSSIWVMRNFLK